MTTTLSSNYEQFKKQNSYSYGGGTKSYDQFVTEMHNAGIKTTHINEGEANFADYGNALSDEVKALVMDSYDCDADYDLQAKIAGIYADAGTNVLKSAQFINACRSLNLEVKVERIATDYIPDWKAGNKNNVIREGGTIGIYTISDGMGGEIVIADANGNAALETEELFMNQILGDINYEISATKGVGAKIDYSSGNYDAAVAENGLFGKNADEITNEEYNTVVEKYYAQFNDIDEAIRRADIETNNFSGKLSYTGSITNEEEKDEIDLTETAKEAAKKETKNSDIVDEAVSETIKEKDKTDDVETIADYTEEVTEDILEEVNFFTE